MYAYKTVLLSLLFVVFASAILILLPFVFHLHTSCSLSIEEVFLTIIMIVVLFLLVDWRTSPHGKQ